MAKDARSQRRRAAVAVLSTVLDEQSLLQELWVQHDTLRGDSVTEIIEYVDALAGRHGLDVGTRKRLYGELFKAVRQPEETLPSDPWPMMQALRPAPAVAPPRAAAPAPVPPAPAWRPAPPPVAPVPAASPAQARAAAMAAPADLAWAAAPVAQPWATVVGMPIPAAAPVAPSAFTAPPPAARPATEPAVVFGAMMRSLVDELAEFHAEAFAEVQLDAVRVLAGSPAPAELREQFQRAWQRARQMDWRLPGRPEDLAELTRVVHRALELALGRVGADQILQRALQAADRVEEAVAFPPRRLLAAI